MEEQRRHAALWLARVTASLLVRAVAAMWRNVSVRVQLTLLSRLSEAARASEAAHGALHALLSQRYHPLDLRVADDLRALARHAHLAHLLLASLLVALPAQSLGALAATALLQILARLEWGAVQVRGQSTQLQTRVVSALLLRSATTVPPSDAAAPLRLLLDDTDADTAHDRPTLRAAHRAPAALRPRLRFLLAACAALVTVTDTPQLATNTERRHALETVARDEILPFALAYLEHPRPRLAHAAHTVFHALWQSQSLSALGGELLPLYLSLALPVRLLL